MKRLTSACYDEEVGPLPTGTLSLSTRTGMRTGYNWRRDSWVGATRSGRKNKTYSVDQLEALEQFTDDND